MDAPVERSDSLQPAGLDAPISAPCCDLKAAPVASEEGSACCPSTASRKRDWLLWGSALTIVIAYLAHLFGLGDIAPAQAAHFFHGVFELINTMWWGLLLGILFVGILHKVPRELVMTALGHGNGLTGILRATGAGLLLDLCNHGILLVGLKLYERGASLGQMMAFLIASPWNSISLTIILMALIGIEWTLVFVALSGVIAILSGLIFERLVAAGVLPPNPNRPETVTPVPFWSTARAHWAEIQWSPAMLWDIVKNGASESTMILRWMFLGVVLAALIRASVPIETFQTYFGPTLLGLGLTLLAATVIEICSEGSSPIAADLVTRAAAPGNGFTFLMAGAATDYTEVMGIKEQTRSWKIALFLPLVTVPQVLVLSLILNLMS